MIYRLVFLFFLLTRYLEAQPDTLLNEYGLQVIKDKIIYMNQVNENPDFALVDLKEFIPGILTDIRYATENNFTGKKFYREPDAFLRHPAALALKLVQEELNKNGLGLKIFDAYRPYSVTVAFYVMVGDTKYVASAWTGSRHNRGCAVDLTVVDTKTGIELEMPTDYDDFSFRAHPDYKDLPEEQIENRELLISVMRKYGFEVYPYEWWHFDFKGWEQYDLMDISFEDLKK